MSLQRAQAHLARFGAADRIVQLEASTATVEQAAAALGVAPAQIAKTLAFTTKSGPVLIVTAGDVRIDNRAYKDQFGEKMRMVRAEEAEAVIGHPPGGICPFGVPDGVRVYLDESLRRFPIVYPACGSLNSAIGVQPEELEQLTEPVGWVNLGAPGRP